MAEGPMSTPRRPAPRSSGAPITPTHRGELSVATVAEGSAPARCGPRRPKGSAADADKPGEPSLSPPSEERSDDDRPGEPPQRLLHAYAHGLQPRGGRP